MANTDDSLVTIYASHSIYLNRVAASFGNNVDPYLENINKQVNKLLSSYSRKTNITNEVRRDIEKQIHDITMTELQAYTTEYKENNKELAGHEVKFHANTLGSVIPSYTASIPSVAAVNSLALKSPFPLGDDTYTTYPRYVNQYHKVHADKIDNAVRSAFLSPSLSMNSLQADIMDQIGALTDKAAKSARTMARTGTSYYNTKTMEAFVDKNDEVLEGYLFIAVHDNSTTRICSSLDQTKWKANDPDRPRLPLHPNERSEMIYDIKSEYKYDDSGSKRPSNFTGADGKRDVKRVSSKQTFYEGLSQKSAKDQDFILQSPTLGKAFRKMESPDEFAKSLRNKMNEPLTIKEMAAKNNELGRILRDING